MTTYVNLTPRTVATLLDRLPFLQHFHDVRDSDFKRRHNHFLMTFDTYSVYTYIEKVPRLPINI